MQFRKLVSGMVTGAVMFGFLASPVLADSLFVDFEFPPYQMGSIHNQDGWQALGSYSTVLGCAHYDQVVTPNNGIPGFGNQSFRISDAVTSGCFADQAFSKPLVDGVGEKQATAGSFTVGTLQNHFEMQFDIASVTPTAQQPGLHVSVSPDRGDGSRMSYLRFEDHADGIHVFFDDVSNHAPVGSVATFNETDIATISRTPHTIKLTMDVKNGPGNDVVQVFVDGVRKITGTSWENYYRYDPEASAEQSPRVIRTVMFRSSGVAVPSDLGNGFYFDNLSLVSSMRSKSSEKDDDVSHDKQDKLHDKHRDHIDD